MVIQKGKVEYKEDNISATQGVEVPDTFITVGATDKYKLLEALNIDWKKITIPWAKEITKWNSANIDPYLYTKLRKYKEDIESSEFNNINNMVDWLNNNYDYLSDDKDSKLPSISPIEVPSDLIPAWAKEGKISDSKDIVEILNYLIWRVVSLDFFTNFWDHRNATFPKWLFVLDWDGNTCDNLTPFEWSDKLNNKFYILSRSNNCTIKITLPPTKEINAKTSDNILLSNDIYKHYIAQNSGLSNQLYLSIYSTSPIAIEITGKDNIMPINQNTIELKVNNYIQGIGNRISVDEEYYYRFKLQNLNALPAQVYGTGEYTTASVTADSWLSRLLNDFNNYDTFFDPKKAKSYGNSNSDSLGISFLQRGGADSNNSNVFTDLADKTLTIEVEKTDNKLKSLSFGSTSLCSNEPTASSASDSNVKRYTFFADTQKVSIPYYLITLSQEENKYEIKFTLDYGKDYGIYPYFFISAVGGNRQYTSSNEQETGKLTLWETTTPIHPADTFKSYTCKYGTIYQDESTGKYFYEPPYQSSNNDDELFGDKPFEINIVFYYNNANRMRELTPIFLTFRVELKARLINSILFLSHGDTNVRLIREANTTDYMARFQPSDWAINDSENGNYINCKNTNNENILDIYGTNNISYCIRTITYDEFIGSSQSIIFDGFVTSVCSDDINIEYIGYTKQHYSANEINIDTDNPNIKINNNVNPSLSLNQTIRVGNQKNQIKSVQEQYPKSFYECTADINKYYSINDTINERLNSSITTLEKGLVEENDDLGIAHNFINENNIIIQDNTEKYIKQEAKINTTDPKFKFKINQATSIYPVENGIFNENNELHDADHEYFYLVFKITCLSGTQVNRNGNSISYKACIGYYFLKVVRRLEIPDLSMKVLNSEQIEYTDAAGNNKSFRLMPRIPIYLNRLFTNESQSLLKKYDGIFDWCIEGYDNKGYAALTLEDTTLAIKDEYNNNGESFITIYNENDAYPTINYSINGRINKEILFVPENNIIIKPSGSGISYKTVKPLGLKEGSGSNTFTHSGAILFINKFVKANKTLDKQFVQELPYVPIEGSFIEMKFYLNIGNSTNFTRMYRIKDQFTVPIYKRKYDFDLIRNDLVSASVTNNIGNPYNLGSRDNTSNSQIYKFKVDGIEPYITGTLGSSFMKLFIASQEFGLGDDSDNIETKDRIKIDLNNGKPCLHIHSLNIDNVININIKEGTNTNYNNWIVDINSGDEIQVNFNYNYNVFGISTYKETINDWASTIYLIGTNPTNQAPAKAFTLEIFGDDEGLYENKNITVYVIVNQL